VQTCSLCHTQAPDNQLTCSKCGADLRELSTTSAALKRMQANPRVTAIRISVAGDACPACCMLQGTYTKDKVPVLPGEGCSGANGCRCFYEPVLSEVFP
jgi:hypothetical protein